MITSFTTSRENAASSDVSPTLRDPGKYICTIVEADTFERSGKSGTYQFVRLLLRADDKRTATVELCVSGGQSNWQAKLFDAVCVCVGVNDPKFVPAKIKQHRRGILDKNTDDGYRCVELEKKRIGVLLQRVWRDYPDKNGEMHEAYDLVLFKPFNPDNELTASEIIAGATTPKNLAAAIEACMKDRDRRKGNAGSSAPTRYAPVSAADTAPTEEEPPF